MGSADAHDDGPVEIPLDLAPMVLPYRRHSRLTVRVERLPHRARLSRGRNNGDRSWSLMPDELEGLVYLPPDGMREAHTLAIRIISLEGGDGATLAVIDYPISGTAPEQGDAKSSGTQRAETRASTAELRRLGDELARVQTALAARDSELEEARAEFDLAEQSRQRVEAELSAARAGREKELRDRLAAAAAEAAKHLEDARKAWEAEQHDQATDLQSRLALERDRWQREADRALAQARAAWKTDAAGQLAAAEKHWREHWARELADSRTRTERIEAELAAAKSEAAASRSRSGDATTDLRNAQSVWNAEEAARLAAAEARWKEQSAKELTEARLRGERAEADLETLRAEAEGLRVKNADAEGRHLSESGELARLRSELASLQAKSSANETELADARQAAERAWAAMDQNREVWQREADTAFAKAESAWKVDQAAQIAKAESKWREQSTRQLAEANARAGKAEAELIQLRAEATATRSSADADVNRSREAFSALQKTLGERETELAQSRAATEEARAGIEKARQEKQAELAAVLTKLQDTEKAFAEWKSEEASRIAAAEAHGRDQSHKALAEAKVQVKEAERALAHVRAQAEGLRQRTDDTEVFRLRDQVAALEAGIADRDIELVQARATAEQARERWARESQHKQEQIEQAGTKRSTRHTGRLVRDVAIVAALAATAIILYPRVEPVLMEGWLPKLEALATGHQVSFADWSGSAIPSPTVAASPAPPAAATSLRAANVRSGPSTASAVIMTLPRGASVAEMERQGNWVHVVVAGDGKAKPQDGWVFKSYLQDNVAASPAQK